MHMLKGAVSAVVPQSVKSYALSTAEYLAPVMTESRFQQEGMLTADEFVAAGDLLVQKCPTWAWSGGDASRARPHLPADKQFLVTRGVPCAQRAKALAGDFAAAHGAEPDDDGAMDEDGWTGCAAPRAPRGRAAGGEGEATLATAAAATTEEDERIPSMEEYEEADLHDEHDGAVAGVRTLSLGGASNVVRTRTYDVSITYDKYYRCPRVWLLGYSEARQPLAPAQVLEDISTEHANKTCTIEPHPHLVSGVFASIHPCRHAEVMKRLCEQLQSGGAVCRADQYLILFLKFISTVIPTIEYDYTMSFEGF
ncbi:hypothetical protein KFE25_011812 [Diacronema lutheri]|uniref:Autophagy-related protein 3 n=2 Tax=Diacronema lutheri TaxID=2081491 RepID=A0A8J5X7S2_DIALT|nr:hypothetical protein KFE25_011812 [Diacronema lutheri]